MGVKKVLWKDGLFVLPQHFQQAERYLTDLMRQSFAAVSPYGYGFYEYVVDLEELKSGGFVLKKAVGLMPDGTPFAMPAQEGIPGARALEDHIGHDQASLDVYLGLPIIQKGKASVPDGTAQMDTRFDPQAMMVTDEVFGRAQEEIEVGGHNFVIRFEGEKLDGLSLLRIARVKWTGDGKLELDEDYIPPLLRISASPKYMEVMSTLRRSLYLKGAELREGRKEGSVGFAEFSSDELTTYGLLNAICTYVPLIDEALDLGSFTHPYRVHTALTMLTGSLQTFVPGREIPKLPRYDHGNIFAALDAFRERLSKIISTDYSTRCVNLALQRSGRAMFECNVTDGSLLADAELYLGISADASDEELISTAKRVIKLSSRENMQRLTVTAMPGLPLAPVHTPPPDLAHKANYVYLKLNKDGTHWQDIVKSNNISFYFPTTYSGLQVELLAVKPK
ncbi:MAG: type VI secretion system baseplate subunit TssK [Chitinivibrionales bacterium]|nr:type VI secretion system baseplate subunit TssK [Chitinivibrionales bacterium]MBD3358471.1 type VI secretion system baseplate subunit TssK [Chitinivibrionales bacterium]